MSYAYPSYKTGTSQDLMSIITRASELHLEKSRSALPEKSPGARPWIEVPFMLLGLLLYRAIELLPADFVLGLHDRMFSKLSSPHAYPFDSAAPALQRAAELYRQIVLKANRAPAVIAVISHPPVLGDTAHLTFELVRHSMLAMRSLRARPCRSRLVVAIDPFALDTIPLYQEGFYCGYMGFYHLGLDRLAFGRDALIRRLLRRTSWDRMPHRFLRYLNEGGEVGMVPAGGVPATARVLYATREWLARERRTSPLRSRPGRVLERLRRFPEFARFETESPLGPGARRSAWRLMEAWAMSALAGVYGAGGQSEPCDESGRLTDAARETLSRCLEALALPESQAAKALAEFAEEFSRETPYRVRLFRVLAGRVLKKGRPVLFLPVVHRIRGGLGIEVRNAWSWEGLSQGKLRGRIASEGLPPWEGGVEEFARRFVTENFS